VSGTVRACHDEVWRAARHVNYLPGPGVHVVSNGSIASAALPNLIT